MISESEFDLDLEELSSAEEFLNYFEVDYDQSVVHVNRLHILQRYHNYLNAVKDMPETDQERYVIYADLLTRAYNDFVNSNAQAEKVLKVFRMGEPSVVKIPISELKLKGASSAP